MKIILNPKSFVFTAVPRRPAATSGYQTVIGKRVQNCFVVSMCQLSSFAIFTIILGLISNLALATEAAPLILFEDSQFRGIRTEYRIDGVETCINIRGKLNDLFSSVQNPESSSCFLLCEHEYCRGRCVQVTESVENLTQMNFNDVVSSIQRCPPTIATSTPTPPVTSTEITPEIPSEDSTSTTTTIIATGTGSRSNNNSPSPTSRSPSEVGN